MSLDLQRYLDIMKRTGMPVIVASGAGEPVVLMPLEAYEAILGSEIAPPTVPEEEFFAAPAPDPAPSLTPPPAVPLAPPEPPAPIPMPNNFRKPSPQNAQNAEDRFFLEPLD